MAVTALARKQKQLDAYEERVLELLRPVLESRVERLMESGNPLPSPDQLADAMAAGIPDAVGPVSYASLAGPFYSSTGVMRLLGITTKQALDDRRRRGTVLAARTDDGVWVYPAFQFDKRSRRVKPGIAQMLSELKHAPRWGAVLWFVTGVDDLNGRSPLQAAGEARGRQIAIGLARQYAAAQA